MSAANLLSDEAADTRYAGNTEFSKTIPIEQESRAVVDQFFKNLSLIIGSKPVLFLVDADRESVYTGTRACTQSMEVGTFWFFLRRNQKRCPEHYSELTNGNGSRIYSLAKPPIAG